MADPIGADTAKDHQLVLAVDDEPANQRAVRRALMDECQVLTATSGQEALAVLASQPVALVIVDQRMPGMRGTEFLVHTVRLHPRVIRVVLTGDTDVDTLVEAINAGHVYHFLSKPWEARELRQVVRRGLERWVAEAERERLMQELEVTCARAQREAEQKGRLLTMTAHELGTPLHIVLNAIALLQETTLPTAARRWVETAERASNWLARSVAQMCTAGRVRDQQFRLRLRATDLRTLLHGVVADLRPAARGRDLEVTTDIQSDLDPVVVDPQWVCQAVTNLLSNAVRFTRDGGRICVRTDADADRIDIAVHDSGIGIPAQWLEQIFEPFSAATGDPLLHGSGRFDFGARGLGLGLAMVQAIAQAHGGSVRVTSTPNVGSCFVLSLPRQAGVGHLLSSANP